MRRQTVSYCGQAHNRMSNLDGKSSTMLIIQSKVEIKELNTSIYQLKLRTILIIGFSELQTYPSLPMFTHVQTI